MKIVKMVGGKKPVTIFETNVEEEMLFYINQQNKIKFKKLPFIVDDKTYNLKNFKLLYKSKFKSNKTIGFWLFRGYNEVDAIYKIAEIQSLLGKKQLRKSLDKTKYKNCKEYYITNGYNEEDALLEAKRYSRRKSPRCIEYYIDKGYTEELALKEIHKIQNNSSHIDYNKRKTSTQYEYWLDKGYSKDEAKQKLKERQATFSLDICIDKYGIEDGKRIFKERQTKWQNTIYTNFTQKELEQLKKKLELRKVHKLVTIY